ncbi:MAG: sulfatase-like hydrolase/transferase, partial [bacterium]|nr:sulfatase-like hydrolase/transferase [bacterium]
MDRPNILIFMTDQEQAQVSFPGHPCQTPNADRLARDGVLFRDCYTVTAHCCPSRASFMTGLYPSRHGIFNNVNT